MRRLFSSHRRFIGAGLMGALVIALAVLGTLWGLSQMASAQAPGDVVLIHVNPDGSDYTGNDYCPSGGTPIDMDADTVPDRAIDDCNNIVSQNHVIRTEGLVDPMNPVGASIEGVGVVVGAGYCGDLAEVINRPLWDDDDGDGLVDEDPAGGGDEDDDGLTDEDPVGTPKDTEACIIIHSSVPGETRVTFVYDDGGDPAVQYTTEGVVKEWDSLLDTVILKADPEDMNGDTVIDADDHHAADEQSTWEDDAVVWDESWKRVRSYPPVELIEIVHGGHEVLINHETIDLHQPTEGAIIKAWITSTHGCTYFTTPTGTFPDIPYPVPYMSFGTMMNGISNAEGRFVGPQVVPDITMPAGLQIPQVDNDGDGEVNEDPPGDANGDGYPGVYLVDDDGDTTVDEGSIDDDDEDGYVDEDGPDSNNGWEDPEGNYDYDSIYVDTTCEEQAVIHFLVGYPDSPGSLKVPVEEWIGINWVTVEEAKQPQIRWAGEEIVLEKRWALPDEFFPNVDEDGFLEPICPLAFTFARYNRLVTSGAGDLVSGLPEIFEPYTQPDRLITVVGADCISAALASSEDQGEGDFEVTLHEWCTEAGGPGICNSDMKMELSSFLWQVNAAIDAGTLTTEEGIQEVYSYADYLVWEGEYFLDPDDFNFSEPINKHAFLVWWLKIYETKLDNIPLDDGAGRADHNAGEWGGEDPIDSEGTNLETLNVSQDALLRVTVKGWFEGGNNSGRGAVCVDLNGNGDGDDTTTDDVPGEPYPIPSYEAGCTDPADEILDHGHWVLPDDLPILAGAYPGFTRSSWDVMSDIGDDITNEGAIGPKSTLDTHDDVPRPWVPCIEYDEEVDEWIWCFSRKTIDPDLEVTVADALMPPLKIRALIADPLDAGFLKQADKDDDVGLDNLYQYIMIPANWQIPPMVNNGGYDWDSWCEFGGCSPSGAVLGPYEFYHVFNYPVQLLEDCDEDIPDELCNYDIGNQADQSTSDVTHPRIIEFYTDNRGLGYFFANGDYNLDFSECSTQALTDTPDCSVGDMVGWSTIQVIGDYPYFRKHPSVLSNPVDKVWEWGGFKDVTHERIDATHLKVMVNLVDRDGYCKYDVDVNDDGSIDVAFSPSEHPVQGEEVEFVLNTEVGSIIDVSPNATYSAPHTPLGEASVTGFEDGVMVNRSEAVALAEDERVLAGDEDADAECTAWVIIEHPLGVDPDVSIILHDPEGDIIRHWPLPSLIISLVQGWNDVCYVGPEEDVADATADIADNLLAVYVYDPTDTEDSWKAYFPANPDISDLDVLMPFEQPFVLMGASADWEQQIQALPDDVQLEGASAEDGVPGAWNAVCYAGDDKAAEEATSDIEGDFEIMYSLGKDQAWRRYVPGRADIPDTLTTLHRFDSVILLVTAEGGTTWVFDP